MWRCKHDSNLNIMIRNVIKIDENKEIKLKSLKIQVFIEHNF